MNLEIFICPYCGAIFSNPNNLGKHRFSKHKDEDVIKHKPRVIGIEI